MTKDVKEFLEGLVGKEIKESGQYVIDVSGDHFNDCFFMRLDLCKKALAQLNDLPVTSKQEA